MSSLEGKVLVSTDDWYNNENRFCGFQFRAGNRINAGPQKHAYQTNGTFEHTMDDILRSTTLVQYLIFVSFYERNHYVNK